MRVITYCQALAEALFQEMEADDSVFVYGIGVPDHKKIFGTTTGLVERFGPTRCFDTPIAEDSMTGFGLGAALCGLRPVHVHIRMDFLMLAMNQLVNVISSCHYGSAGRLRVPLVVRTVVGRGWGQGFQHSKSLHATFAHIPGLKVVAPTTPYDAKGMLAAAIRDDNPVLFIEHRWLYWQEGAVPEERYTIDFGKAHTLRQGEDLTLVATSWMNVEAMHAARILERVGISVEIIDPRAFSPLDMDSIVASARKTGRVIVADNDWVFCGLGAEIAAQLQERCFGELKAPVRRIGFQETPCPTARHLENVFYPNAGTIVDAAAALLGIPPVDMSQESFYSHEKRFKGPF